MWLIMGGVSLSGMAALPALTQRMQTSAERLSIVVGVAGLILARIGT